MSPLLFLLRAIARSTNDVVSGDNSVVLRRSGLPTWLWHLSFICNVLYTRVHILFESKRQISMYFVQEQTIPIMIDTPVAYQPMKDDMFRLWLQASLYPDVHYCFCICCSIYSYWLL